MATQVNDPFLAVKIDGTGATHYKVSHETSAESTTNLDAITTATRLPVPEEDGTFIVRHDLPNVPGTYFVKCKLNNSLDISDVASEEVLLLGSLDPDVSTLYSKLRIAQSFGCNADPDTYADGINCAYSWISLYNNSAQAIDLSAVAIWTRYQNATSTIEAPATEYTTVPDYPALKSAWTKHTLSGTIQPGKYFLIRGAKIADDHFYDVATGLPLDEETFNFGIQFTAIAGEDASNAGTKFFYDLSLPTLFLSSKMVEIFVADNSLTEVPVSLFNIGALTPHFIDLYGATAAIDPLTEEYLAPEAMAEYYLDNSKQKVKTIIAPTVNPANSLTDYTATSIKAKSAATIIATATMRPRNSLYVAV